MFELNSIAVHLEIGFALKNFVRVGNLVVDN